MSQYPSNYALPPGVYTIMRSDATDQQQGVTDADEGDALSFTSLDNNNGPNSPDQQWLVNGSGVIRARESSRFAYVNQNTTRQNIRSGSVDNKTEWIIGNITWHPAGYYKVGSIMTSETQTASGRYFYWGHDLTLQYTPGKWIFTPVAL